MRAKKLRKIVFAAPLAAVMLYAGGYLAQIARNYSVWTRGGGYPGDGTAPRPPSLAPPECFGAVFSLPCGVVFIRLAIGVNAVAHSCYDSRTPGKKDDVSFAVTHIDEEHNAAIEEPFEKDGFIFNLEKIRFEEVKNSVAKDARQTVTVITQTDDPGEILKRFTIFGGSYA